MKTLLFASFFILVCSFGFAQTFIIDSLPKQGILLDKGWKWHAGDNPEWAKADFDDLAWTPIDATQDIGDLSQIFDSKIKWLRLDFEVKSKFTEQVGLSINQVGASEIYLNGRLVKQIGYFDVDLNKVIANDPRAIPFYLPVDSAGKYNLAIRYVLQPNILYTKLFNNRNLFFKASFVPLVPTLNSELNSQSYRVGLEIFKLGIFLILFILHAAFYFNQKNDKAHLLLTLIFLSLAALYFLGTVTRYDFNVSDFFWHCNLLVFLYLLAFCLQLAVLYYFAKVKIDFSYRSLIVFAFITEFLAIFSFNYGNLGFLLFQVAFLFFLLRITIIGLKKKIKGFRFLSVGVILNILALIFTFAGLNFLQVFKISIYLVDLIYNVGFIAFPIGLSIYMGLKSSDTNKELTEKLTENEILKEHAVNQEKEKQQILSTQNETLEKQVKERTAELVASQNQLIQSEKLASLGELTAGIAHEIQNPLNFVNNFSELSVELIQEIKSPLTPDGGILDGQKVDMELIDDVVQNLTKINEHGKRASSIVTGMLEHSRASTGVKELTDINKLADEYLRLSYHGLRAKDKNFNADFEFIADPDLPKINVIPQDIGRVLLNIINNAFQAVQQKAQSSKGTEAKSNPKVEIRTQLSDNKVEIKIKDNGSGMSEATKAKIFQPFFTTKPTGQGTGLGLSLAYDIITKGHGGTLEVVSTEGVGSEFIISLPFKTNS